MNNNRLVLEAAIRENPDFARLSNNALGVRFGIHYATARRARLALEATGSVSPVGLRIGLNGRLFDVSRVMARVAN